MSKRSRSEDAVGEEALSTKRPRTDPGRNLLDITDEILLRVLSHLSTRDLLRAEYVSSRMRILASDRGLWKVKFLASFFRHRLRRDPTAGGIGNGTIDWKSCYKTETNWSNGKARLHELEVADPHTRSHIATVHNGLIYTAGLSGLRAWSSKDTYGTSRAHLKFSTASEATCITAETIGETTYLLVGFANGSSSIYTYSPFGQWEHVSSHHSPDGSLLGVALAYPYSMTVSKTKVVSIYQLNRSDPQDQGPASISTLAQLQSNASLSPISVSIRHTPRGIIAAVAYAFNRLHSGWCLGLQEIRLNTGGHFLDSRLVSTLDIPPDSSTTRKIDHGMKMRFASSTPLPLYTQPRIPPTSLSYQHPYLVSTLADNTLISYLVTSTEEKLEITSATRLWGHTSAVSGAEVDRRGKAVSVSSRGDLWVWELEAIMTGRQFRAKTQVQVIEVRDAMSGITTPCTRWGSRRGLPVEDVKREREMSRRWVGFDEQQVVVLGETTRRKQIMSLYDFT